jgi:hypothetical protein
MSKNPTTPPKREPPSDPKQKPMNYLAAAMKSQREEAELQAYIDEELRREEDLDDRRARFMDRRRRYGDY